MTNKIKKLEKSISDISQWGDFFELMETMPSEMGFMSLYTKETQSRIKYIDWTMCFKENLEANRKGHFGMDDIQIIFVTNQNCNWEIEGKEKVEVKIGELCAYCNYCSDTSKMTYEKNKEYRFVSLTVSPEDFEKWVTEYFSVDMVSKLRDLFLGEFRIYKTNITDKMYNLIDEINQLNAYREFSDALMDCKVNELMLVSLYQLIYNPDEEVKLVKDDDSLVAKQLYRLARYISIHPQEEYIASDIAENMSISVSKLNREFRRRFDTSLHSYVIDKRLSYAAALLREGHSSVSEVAYSCGYTNMSHFSKAFVEKYSVLPKEYKKKMSEKH